MTVAERPACSFGITVLEDDARWTESLPLTVMIFSGTTAVDIEPPETIPRKSLKRTDWTFSSFKESLIELTSKEYRPLCLHHLLGAWEFLTDYLAKRKRREESFQIFTYT